MKREMGIVDNIDYNTFPKQGPMLGKEVIVCFKYNTKEVIKGIFVRDDTEEPFIEIIKLEDDRYVLTTECMWSDST